MSATTPRRGRPGYDADTILRRAIELFIRQGYEATSMGDLALELGLSKSAIYHHVPSKEHLLAAALDEALDGLSLAIDDAVETEALSSYTRLQTAVRSSVEVLVAHLPAVTLLLRVRGKQRGRDRGAESSARARRPPGRARPDRRRRRPPAPRRTPKLISRLLFGMVNSLVERYRPDGPVSVEELADALTGLAFEGLRSESG